MKQTIHFWQSIQFIYGLVLLACVLVLIGLATFAQNNLREQNDLVYQDRKQQRIDTFNQITGLHTQAYAGFVNENTYWDEMVAYAAKPTKAFEDTNIRPTLYNQQLDATWVYNAKFSLVGNVNMFEAKYQAYKPRLSPDQIKAMFAKKHTIRYFEQTPLGLMELFGSTIQASNDPQRLQPAAGYYFTGRLVDEKVIKNLASEIQGDITLVSGSHSAGYRTTFPTSSGKMAFNVPLNNANGTPVSYYHVTYTAYSIRQIADLTERLIIINVVTYILLSIVLLIAFIWLIARPLGSIYHSLQNNNSDSVAGLQSSHTEFGRIATLITATFLQRTELRNTVRQMTATQNSLENRTEELEKMNSLMMNRELKMIELKARIKELEPKAGKGKRP